MSVPSRRRNPVITRGKKSDKKKEKLERLQVEPGPSMVGFAEILEKAERQRKELFLDGSSTADKKILSEPSQLFFRETGNIHSTKKGVNDKAILLGEQGYEAGINASKVKQERLRVIDGGYSRIFRDLGFQFKEQKTSLLQGKRKSQKQVLETARKREEKNKNIAAKEKEEKRVIKELERREVARLQVIERERLETERLAKIGLQKQQEVARLQVIERERLETERLAKIGLQKQQKRERSKLAGIDYVLKKKKKTIRQRLWSKVKNIFLSKKKRLTPLLKENISGTQLLEIDEVIIVDVVEVPIQKPVIEEVIIQEEIQVSPKKEPIEEVIIQEEIQVSPKKEPIEEVIIQEEIQAPPMKEPIKEVTFELEDPVILGPVVEEAVENDFEELPDFQTGERILADLRIIMRDEPRPIDFITKILKEKHNFSHRDVNALIDHVASPFSICKTLNDDLFQRFIRSLEVEKESGEGVEIWTQVIQIIGFETLSEGQLVDIYNMFMGDVKKKNQRVITIALLLHALPERFDRWWKKEMIPDYISEKYDSDYNFYLDKGFSEDVVEEAIILLCAYAIERPELVAKEYTYAKHEAGKNHENKTEEWLKKGGGKIEYITESQIQKLQGEKYGSKFVNPRITPDILLKVPIQLSEEGQHIHWIDAKKQFIDPSLSPEYKVTSFCNQLNKYVKNYGPGLIVWGKNFSEEWNEATKGVVQHIKI